MCCPFNQRPPPISICEYRRRAECAATRNTGIRRLEINTQYALVWPNITVKREPPPDAKEWEGKPDKAKLLSPNPGTGD
jgi:hypothetical protein